VSGVGVNDIPVGFGVLGLGDNEVVGIGLSEFRLFGLFYLFDFFNGGRLFGCHVNE